jgi:hypothetical protein
MKIEIDLGFVEKPRVLLGFVYIFGITEWLLGLY